MKRFQSLSELLLSLSELHWDSAIFVSKRQWSMQPEATPLVVLEGDDELEDLADSGSHLPKLAAAEGLEQLLDIETLRDVIDFELRRNPRASIVQFLQVLNYYLKHDDFYDPGPHQKP